MAIVNFTGFECGLEEVSQSGGWADIAVGGRSGDKCLRIYPPATYSGYVNIKNLTANGVMSASIPTSGRVRFYIKVSTFPYGGGGEYCRTFGIGTGSTPNAMVVELGAAGGLRLACNNRANVTDYSQITLTANKWYRVEVPYDYLGSTAGLFIDGFKEFEVNFGMGPTTPTSYIFGNEASMAWLNEHDYRIDDFIATDTQDTIGPGKGAKLDPIGAGYSAFASQTGTYADVDDWASAADPPPALHDGDTTYIATSASGAQICSLDCESSSTVGIPAVAMVRAVKAIVVARDESATVAWRPGIRGGSTNSFPTALDGGPTYGYNDNNMRAHILETDPSTSLPWTLSGLDAAEVICNKTQTQARALRCTAMSLFVEYDDTTYMPPIPGWSGSQRSRRRR